MPLGKRTDCGDARFAGVTIPFVHDVAEGMQAELLCGFDFVVAPLVDPAHTQPALELPPGEMAAPRTRRELMLSSAQWGGQIVGRTSEWIDPDSSDRELAARSGRALAQELEWASFLGLQAVVVAAPPNLGKAVNFSRIVNRALEGLSHMALWVQLPMAPPPGPRRKKQQQQQQQQQDGTSGAGDAGAEPAAASPRDPWDDWQQLFALCERSNLLGVLLEVPADLPPAPLIRRWLGQPLKALALPTAVFGTNKRGYPVLSKAHQDLLSLGFRHGVQVVLTGGPLHRVAPAPTPPPPPPPPRAPAASSSASPAAASASDPPLPAAAAAGPAAAGAAAPGDFPIINPGEAHGLRPYWEYLCYAFRRVEDPSAAEALEAGYRDYLQAPLQPLMDNLESQTYETFEKDITKYATYQEAVRRALLDRVPEAEAAAKVTTLMVVGAGRGPLVRASIAAAGEARRLLRVWAVEKNPAAVVHIQAMVEREGWGDMVTIVKADMRTWSAPHAADILVSELLGSFGDNELSPECLDGAQRFLAPGGVSIPRSYTSFMAPVTTSKLYEACRAYKDLEHFETPYVVKLHRFYMLSPPQPVFTFEHPNTDTRIDNNRAISLTFPRAPEDGAGELHGFAGYFEAELYPGVLLSTHPPTHTPHMFSWFPIFFPLREPMLLPAGAAVEAHMWRVVGPHKVWYEWAVTRPAAGAVHNAAGRSYWVGL
ncbi:MAG: PRMT5 arginine-N-methyltransferase-domain-containing protein [Monoraphidium minutum]|nr:MAG: PRMT5 arginine-N-methyltransferase-domain-containing protein [Monoraphidium minutum]